MHSSYLKGEEPQQLLAKRMREEGRLPPRQSASIKWPVLHVGADPAFDAATWHVKTGGLVDPGREASRQLAGSWLSGAVTQGTANFPAWKRAS